MQDTFQRFARAVPDVLVEAIDSPACPDDPLFISVIVGALVSAREKRVIPIAVRLLSHQNHLVRSAAIKHLAEMHSSVNMPAHVFVRLLSDPNAAVRDEAARFLGLIPGAGEEILNAYVDGRVSRAAAEDAFVKLEYGPAIRILLHPPNRFDGGGGVYVSSIQAYRDRLIKILRSSAKEVDVATLRELAEMEDLEGRRDLKTDDEWMGNVYDRVDCAELRKLAVAELSRRSS